MLYANILKICKKLTFNYRKSIPFRRIIFLHIGKTAGTSVTEHIFEYCKHSKHMGWSDWIAIPRSSLENYFFISGHFGFDYISDILKGSYSFTFLRNPVERVLSEYNQYLRIPINEKTVKLMPNLRHIHQMSFEEYIESDESEGIVNFSNMQTWSLAKSYDRNTKEQYKDEHGDVILEMAIQNLHKLSYVGFKETFEKDFNNVLNDLNIPLPLTNRVRNRSPKPTNVNSIPSHVLKKLELKVALDQKLYEYAWNNLQK